MKNSALHWLYAVPGRKKGSILALALLQALSGASGVFYALLLRSIVDAAVGQDAPGFWRGLLWIILLVTAQLLLRALIRWLTELSKASLENLFKERLMDTLLRREYLQVSSVHSGEWMNRLTNDTAVVANGYVEIFPGLAGMAVKLVSALVMILVLEPRFAVIFIPGGLILMLFTWLFRQVLKSLHRKVQEADGKLRVFLQERIASLLVVHSFAAEEKTLEETGKKTEAHKAARMRRNRFSNFCNIGFGGLMNGMVLLGVGWCAYGILKGTISFGTLTAITQLITQIQIPFANITGYMPRYFAMLASAERLMEAEDFDREPEEVLSVEETEAIYRDLSGFGFSDVSFAYYPSSDKAGAGGKEGMPNVLSHLSLDIRKGEYVALTGQSGCGKSTALKLFMCVYEPDSGKRYYRNTDGREGEMTSAFRRLFAYVPQDNALMTGTIREAVTFADPEAAQDEERLGRALQIACAQEFVEGLRQGADTLLGERGTGLSEGQMQRLAVARAVFSGSPVLLLDEATSALDMETETRLLENLKSMTDKTVIIVTHRPAVLSICDRVLELTGNGEIRYDD